MDLALFFAINYFADRNPFLDATGVFLATWAIFLLALMGVLVAGGHIRRWLHIVLAPLFAYGINALLGYLYFRPRPFVAYEVHRLIEKSGTDKSFPSDHTAVSFAIAAALSWYNPRLGIVAYVCAGLIGISRIFVGVHYPTDVLAGALIGIASAYGVGIALRRLLK